MQRAQITVLGFLAISLLGAGCAATGPRSLTWDILPFPRDSDWPAWNGMPAKLEDGELVLQGHPVRTRAVYSVPLTIECEFELENRVAPDGYCGIGFVPAGSPDDVGPRDLRWLQIAYRGTGAGTGRDGLSFLARDSGSRDKLVWGEEPFVIQAQKYYAIRLEVTEDHVRVVIDGHPYDLNGVKIPYKQFRVQLNSWQPTDRWHVRNLVLH